MLLSGLVALFIKHDAEYCSSMSALLLVSQAVPRSVSSSFILTPAASFRSFHCCRATVSAAFPQAVVAQAVMLCDRLPSFLQPLSLASCCR